MNAKFRPVKSKSAVVPYNSLWPEQFKVAAKTLKIALGDFALSIRHIGSTAVPGLAAKDRIDIQISIVDLTHNTKKEIDRALQTIGLRQSEQFDDHRPAGNTSAGEHWQKFLSWGRAPSWDFDANIHFRVTTYDNHQFAILFRDFLIANKDAPLRRA